VGVTTNRTEAGRSKAAVAQRKKLFIERYLVNGNNATEAAKFAGFSDKVACQQGFRLLQREDVKALLGRRAEEIVQDVQLTTERWAKEMACIGHFDPGELYDADGNLIPIHKLPEHVRRAISSVEIESRREGRGEDAVTVQTSKIKLWDKNTALANVGKHLGAFEPTIASAPTRSRWSSSWWARRWKRSAASPCSCRASSSSCSIATPTR
jgi:phage terminase small subunit